MKEMEAEVSRALKGGNCHEVLSEGFGLSLTRKDLQTLSNLNWLNDEVRTCCFITARWMSALWSWAVRVVCPLHWNSSSWLRWSTFTWICWWSAARSPTFPQSMRSTHSSIPSYERAVTVLYAAGPKKQTSFLKTSCWFPFTWACTGASLWVFCPL